jgi:opacity protein-like surface antigen
MKFVSHKAWIRPATAALLLGAPSLSLAQTPTPSKEPNIGTERSKHSASTKKSAPAAKAAQAPTAAPAEKKSYYVPTRAYRLEPASDTPAYVRNLGKTYKEFEGIDWLNIGLDSRVRFEYRSDDYRPWTSTVPGASGSQRKPFANSLWLSRTRFYLGVQNILDPFRAVVEFQDSRAYNSIYQYQGQEINETDLISAYGELFFKDALGKDDRGNNRPLTLRAGRFHLELLDKRLIGENEFRNTTNNFDGFRVKVGGKDNDWDIDSFLMRPVNRDPYAFDRPDWQTWIYGSVVSIRRWSEYATIQPYFIGRRQFADPLNASNALKVHRITNAPGLRVYGTLGNFDYDFDINKQFGEMGEFRAAAGKQNAVQTTVQNDAIAYALELGYTIPQLAWKPRFSADYTYGSGNKSPFDSVNQTFDIFYGFNQPFSRNDYFAWNNTRAVKGRIEITPAKDLQLDAAFSAYWLASTASPWDRANLSAPLGNRGDFLGTEVDFRARYKLSQFVTLSASYARFWPGAFTSSFAPLVALQNYFPQSYSGQTGTTNGLTGRPTDFVYLEATFNAFGDGQPITSNPARDFLALASPESWSKAKAPSWRDVYAGLSGGGAWSNPQSDVSVTPLGAGLATGAVAAASGVADKSNSLAGFLGGLQVGANWRFDNNIVAGVEADLHGVSGNTDTKWQASRIAAAGETFVNYGQRTATLNYLGTLRGKLGYLVTPTLQLYGTGGLAYGGVISNTALLSQRIGGSVALTNPQFQDSLAGWAAGGGVEWALSPAWSVKVEYLHYDLGSVTATATGAATAFYQLAASNRTNFDGNFVQAGVNRHFDLFETANGK